MSAVARVQRFTKHRLCPICGGHARLPNGRGIRCSGFLSSDGRYAHCSREERAPGLPLEDGGTYAHLLAGPCKCGQTHGTAPAIVSNGHRFEAAPQRVYRDHRDAGAVRAYDYTDQTGALLFQVWRYANPKSFKQARPVPGGWSMGIRGVRRVLYRLPDLLAGDPDAWLCLCEGEKDADTVTALGVLGTTNPMGAKVWAEEYTQSLAGRRVAILEDNDTDGRAGAAKKATALVGVAREVRVVPIPDVPDGGDVSDWAAAGGDEAALRALIDAAPDWRPQGAARFGAKQSGLVAAGTTFDCIEAKDVDWLWPGVLAAGFLSEVIGDPGVGKSLVSCDVAACLSSGRALPGAEARDPVGVVILSYEDDPAIVIRGRLEVAKADLSRIFSMHGVVDTDGEVRDAILPADVEAVLDAIDRVDAKLVIVDPLVTSLDPHFDTHKDSDMKRALRPLTKLAIETGVTVLGVRHPNKSERDALRRAGGSIGITGTQRASTYLALDPEDESRHLLLPVKNNLGVAGASWGFRIEAVDRQPRVVWEANAGKLSANDVLSQDHSDPDERGALTEACEWLGEFLTSPKPVAEIQKEARAAGISARTLERAKARLGYRSTREGFGGAGQWMWAQPDHIVGDDDA